MNIIAIIPARGGSKGIIGKNLYPLLNKPLIVYSIEQALKASLVSKVIVSTDCNEIALVSIKAGASVIPRPQEISGDEASSEDALIHAINHLSGVGLSAPDLIVFLQCTSPIRTSVDIDNAIKAIIAQGADSLLSVSLSHRFLWIELKEGAKSVNYDFRQRPRRQDMSPQYLENGSIYIFKPKDLLKTRNRLGGKIALYKMDEAAAIDIDSMQDMLLAETILKERLG